MPNTTAIWPLIAVTACLQHPLPASGLPPDAPAAALARRLDMYPSPWVSVNSAGAAQTFSPTVQTTNGAVETISAPPASLTQTEVWTLTVNGQPTTSTGTNPVATGSGVGDDGTFMLCSNNQGPYAPFCQPRTGGMVAPGHVYFVTWDPSHYAEDNATVQIGADYGHGQGFISETMLASKGFYPWVISADILQIQTNLTMQAALYIQTMLAGANGTSSSDAAVKESGPVVTIASAEAAADGGSVSGPNVIAIALPLILAIVVLGIGLGLLIYVRRRKYQPEDDNLNELYDRPEGYGPSPSQLGRLGSVNTRSDVSSRNNDFQLTDRESWTNSPHGQSPPGKNMFREEIARQDRVRI